MEDLRSQKNSDTLGPFGLEPGRGAALFGHPICTVSAFFIADCDPVVSIAGATFPVWMLCLFAGILISFAIRPLFVVTGIDEWLTPRPLIYACLAMVTGFLCWIVIWR
jgi:hypothetical protein